MNYAMKDFKHLKPVKLYMKISTWKIILGTILFIILWGLSDNPYGY